MTTREIKTERLRIVPFTDRHLHEGYVGWLNDKQLMRLSEQRHREHSLESCRSYLESFAGTPHFFWAVEASDMDNLHIGNMNAYFDVNNGVVDVGIVIGHDAARGRGYGQEAWNGVIDFLKDVSGVRKITAGAMAANTAMLKIARRSGMREDGRRVRQYLLDGQEVDIVYMALFVDGRQG